MISKNPVTEYWLTVGLGFLGIAVAYRVFGWEEDITWFLPAIVGYAVVCAITRED